VIGYKVVARGTHYVEFDTVRTDELNNRMVVNRGTRTLKLCGITILPDW
jgi:hypothetical protein